MAALQKIRSKGPLLVLVIALGLFAFIAGDYAKGIEIFSSNNRQTIGKVYGETLKYTEFQEQVDEFTEVVKLSKLIQQQSDNLTDQEQEQIRLQVWSDFARRAAIRHEAGKFGLSVTDEDVQDVLRTGQARSLQVLASVFPSQQGGLDVSQYQQFLKAYETDMPKFRQAGNTQAIEQYERLHKVSEYSLKQLREEILENKFYMTLRLTAGSNKETAKVEFDLRNTLTDADVVAIPYSTIADDKVTVTDADLKKAYKQYRETPYVKNPIKSANLQVLDIQVTASQADRDTLQKQVAAAQQQLAEGIDAATVVGAANSDVHYINLAMSKEAFAQFKDVQDNLDSLSVGQVKPVYYNDADNTLNTIKLIAKEQAPDSVLYRVIAAPAATLEESATRADSILTALKGGASFKELAAKYQQSGDSSWISSAQYEDFSIDLDAANFYSTLYQGGRGLRLIKLSQGNLVAEVLDVKGSKTKYNVAIVKRQVNFSKQTYNTALNKINQYLAENRDIKSFVQNAGKAGYLANLQPYAQYNQSNHQLQMQIGGASTKEALKWVFDEAKAGDISRLYETGRGNDHLLVIGVEAINDDSYLPLEEESVKQYLTNIVRQQKKAELILEQTKGVKTLADAKKQKGAVNEQLAGISLLGQTAQLAAVGVSEPNLTGAIVRTEKGKFTGAVKGAAAVYFAQVGNRTNSGAPFDAKAEQAQITQRLFQSIVSQSYFGTQEILIPTLIQEKGKLKDNLYRF